MSSRQLSSQCSGSSSVAPCAGTSNCRPAPSTLSRRVSNTLTQSLPRLDGDFLSNSANKEDALPNALNPNFWATPKRYAPSPFARSRELGHLDPQLYIDEKVEEVYRQQPGHLGRLWYWLSYRVDHEQLQVKVIKARNLKFCKEQATDVVGSQMLGDSFVKVYLQQDDRRTMSTAVHRKTCDPNYEETFLLQVPQGEFASQTLRLDVLSLDRHNRTRMMGFVRQPLSIILTGSSSPQSVATVPLVSSNGSNPSLNNNNNNNNETSSATADSAVDSQLFTNGKFSAITNLAHKQLGATNTPSSSLTASPSRPPISMSRRAVHSCRLFHDLQPPQVDDQVEEYPELNIGLMYTKAQERLSVSILECKNWPRRGKNGELCDKVIGSTVIGPEMIAKRKGLQHWQKMLRQTDSQVTQFHKMCPTL